jgi:hypothetical protein
LGFRVLVNGHTSTDVNIYVDGELKLKRLDGKALELNPGVHSVRIEVPGFAPKEEEILLTEGERFRIVPAEFGTAHQATRSSSPGSTPAVVEEDSGIPLSTYVLGSIGVVGAISGAAWGLSSLSARSELEAGCAPDCTDESINVVRQRALFADISWGVSAVSVIGATITYFVYGQGESSGPTVDVAVLPGGGAFGSVTFSAD